MLTVGGESIGDDSKWSTVRRNITLEEKRVVVSRIIEMAVLVCMNTHVYSFGPDLFLQQSGGPIGMRFTAALANVVMKMWDCSWIDLMKKEGVKWDLYLRYVDDCRLFLPSFNRGWFWDGAHLTYSKERAEEDERSALTVNKELRPS